MTLSRLVYLFKIYTSILLMNVSKVNKKINRLISKRMWKFYSNSSQQEKLAFLKLWFCKFKKFAFRSIFGELQLTQISLNFKTSCYNLKIRNQGGKRTWEAFFLLRFIFEIFHFKQTCTLFFHVKRGHLKLCSLVVSNFCLETKGSLAVLWIVNVQERKPR